MSKMEGLRCVLLAAACGSALAFQAFAQEVREVNVAAGDLRAALQQYVRQTGVQLVYRPEQLRGRTTQGARGALTPEQAVGQLIEGTGLELSEGADGVWLIVAPDAREAPDGDPQRRVSNDGVHALDAVQVFARMSEPLSVGSKSGQSLRETAKSVTLVTRERLEAQNLNSLADALVQTTGVTVAGYSGVESFWMSRGFRLTTLQIDGGAPAYSTGYGAWVMPDMATYDHLEMLRGVDGMYTGAGRRMAC